MRGGKVRTSTWSHYTNIMICRPVFLRYRLNDFINIFLFYIKSLFKVWKYFLIIVECLKVGLNVTVGLLLIYPKDQELSHSSGQKHHMH